VGKDGSWLTNVSRHCTTVVGIKLSLRVGPGSARTILDRTVSGRAFRLSFAIGPTLLRKLPLWFLIVSILTTASITSVVFVLPNFLHAKPDIALTSFPSSPTTLAAEPGRGGVASFTLNVRTVNNFTGIVSARIVGPPLGMSAYFDGSQALNPDAIPMGHSENVTVDLTASVSGNFTLTIDFTSGTLIRSISVPIISQGLGVDFNPSPLTISKGSSANTVVTLQSQNGLSGNVTIDTIPNPPPGVSPMAFSPKVVMLPRGGTVQMTLTIQTFSSASSGSATQYFASEIYGSVIAYRSDSFNYVVQ